MTKEELIMKLYEEKAKGIKFKTIAKEIGVNSNRIALFIHRKWLPDKKLCLLLTEYFNKKEMK